MSPMPFGRIATRVLLVGLLFSATTLGAQARGTAPAPKTARPPAAAKRLPVGKWAVTFTVTMPGTLTRADSGYLLTLVTEADPDGTVQSVDTVALTMREDTLVMTSVGGEGPAVSCVFAARTGPPYRSRCMYNGASVLMTLVPPKP
jgi:hypothetical protein